MEEFGKSVHHVVADPRTPLKTVGTMILFGDDRVHLKRAGVGPMRPAIWSRGYPQPSEEWLGPERLLEDPRHQTGIGPADRRLCSSGRSQISRKELFLFDHAVQAPRNNLPVLKPHLG